MDRHTEKSPKVPLDAPLGLKRLKLLICTWHQPTCVVKDIELTVLSATRNSSESLELVSTQSVQSLMSGGVLDKPSLVTEPVVAVLPHAVEMGLVLSVVAVSKLTILIEPKYKVVKSKLAAAAMQEYYI